MARFFLYLDKISFFFIFSSRILTSCPLIKLCCNLSGNFLIIWFEMSHVCNCALLRLYSSFGTSNRYFSQCVCKRYNIFLPLPLDKSSSYTLRTSYHRGCRFEFPWVKKRPALEFDPLNFLLLQIEQLWGQMISCPVRRD